MKLLSAQETPHDLFHVKCPTCGATTLQLFVTDKGIVTACEPCHKWLYIIDNIEETYTQLTSMSDKVDDDTVAG